MTFLVHCDLSTFRLSTQLHIHLARDAVDVRVGELAPVDAPVPLPKKNRGEAANVGMAAARTADSGEGVSHGGLTARPEGEGESAASR